MSCPGKWILSHQVRISHYCSTKFFMKFIHGTKPWLRNTRGFALPQIVENFEQLCVTPCIIQWKPVEQLSVRHIFCNMWLSPAWAKHLYKHGIESIQSYIILITWMDCMHAWVVYMHACMVGCLKVFKGSSAASVQICMSRRPNAGGYVLGC